MELKTSYKTISRQHKKKGLEYQHSEEFTKIHIYLSFVFFSLSQNILLPSANEVVGK